MSHSDVRLHVMLVLTVTAAFLASTSVARVIGPFPGYFGNQVCVRQEGLDAKDGESSFLTACKRLDKVKKCYDDVIDPKNSPMMNYLGTAFNVSKFTSVYKDMCDKLQAYVAKNGHANLVKLDSANLRKQVYFKAFIRASRIAQEYNDSAEYIKRVCRSAVDWTDKAEAAVASDAYLRQLMNETNWNSLSDTCHALFAPKTNDPTVFPAVLGIPLAKPARICMNRTVPQFSYLYDEKIQCDKNDTTYWVLHLSCKRAEEMLECTNRYLIQGSFMPKSITHLAQYLFDLDVQKKAFRAYCASPRVVRNQLQCLPLDVVNSALAACNTPWLRKVTELLSGDQKRGLKKEVCKETIERIECEKEVMSRASPNAARLYAKLQSDGLPSICIGATSGESRLSSTPAMMTPVTSSNDASCSIYTHIFSLSSLLLLIDLYLR